MLPGEHYRGRSVGDEDKHFADKEQTPTCTRHVQDTYKTRTRHVQDMRLRGRGTRVKHWAAAYLFIYISFRGIK